MLEVVANPLNIHEYSTYSWIFNTFMEMVHAIDEFLPMRRVEYDHEEVPFSMDKYSIHGCNILSMDLEYPWVPCNIYDDLNLSEEMVTSNRPKILSGCLDNSAIKVDERSQ